MKHGTVELNNQTTNDIVSVSGVKVIASWQCL